MIFQPFNNAELQAIAQPANLVSTRQTVRGMQSYRVWNVTPWWWDIREEGDAGRLIGLATPWTVVQGNFEDQELLELVFQVASDLPVQTVAAMTVWRFMVEFSPDKLDFRFDQVLGNL